MTLNALADIALLPIAGIIAIALLGLSTVLALLIMEAFDKARTEVAFQAGKLARRLHR